MCSGKRRCSVSALRSSTPTSRPCGASTSTPRVGSTTRPRWLRGSDQLLDELVAVLPLRQRTGVRMYDRIVSEPRLSAWWQEQHGRPEPLPMLRDMRLRAGRALRRAVRLDRLQPVPRRARLGCMALRPPRQGRHQSGRRDRQPRRAAAVPDAPEGRRSIACLGARRRRSVRDGRRQSARLGAHRAQGARRHDRAADCRSASGRGDTRTRSDLVHQNG